MDKRKSMKPFLVYFTEKELKNLKEESIESGIPMAEILRRLVDSYYKVENKIGARLITEKEVHQ